MKPSTIHRQRELRIQKAVVALYNGISVRKAASVYSSPNSTVHDAFYAPVTPRLSEHKKRALTNGEEKQIVCLLRRYSDKGVPLTRQHVIETVQRLVAGFPPYRRITLPFKDCTPGSRYIRSFLRRHNDELLFVKPLRQQHERFRAVNADVLCQHVSTLERIVVDLGLDPERIWNLDECGVTPGRDDKGASARKRIVTQQGSRDFRSVNVGYNKKVTFMPAISASGETGPCLFLYKSKSFPYRCYVKNGEEHVDSIARNLPRSATIEMREKGGGVDSDNFLKWADCFVNSVSDLTANGRKLLFIYDGYRSHMSLTVLHLFADNNIVVYALSAHTSGKTQPLDVVASSVFKKKLSDLRFESTGRFVHRPTTVFAFTDMLIAAYHETFTSNNIQSSFVRSGVWPVDRKRLMNVSRPRDSTLNTTYMVEEMEGMIQARRQMVSESIFGEQVIVTDTGFVDTRMGAVLNTVQALNNTTTRARQLQKGRHQAKIQQEQSNLHIAASAELQRAEARRMKDLADVRRARLCGMSLESYRHQVLSLGERRAQARLRCAQKKSL